MKVWTTWTFKLARGHTHVGYHANKQIDRQTDEHDKLKTHKDRKKFRKIQADITDQHKCNVTLMYIEI